MNRAKIRNVREVLDRVMAQHADEFRKAGVLISTGNASFGMTDAKMRLFITDISASVTTVSPAVLSAVGAASVAPVAPIDAEVQCSRSRA